MDTLITPLARPPKLSRNSKMYGVLVICGWILLGNCNIVFSYETTTFCNCIWQLSPCFTMSHCYPNQTNFLRASGFIYMWQLWQHQTMHANPELRNVVSYLKRRKHTLLYQMHHVCGDFTVIFFVGDIHDKMASTVCKKLHSIGFQQYMVRNCSGTSKSIICGSKMQCNATLKQ